MTSRALRAHFLVRRARRRSACDDAANEANEARAPVVVGAVGVVGEVLGGRGPSKLCAKVPWALKPNWAPNLKCMLRGFAGIICYG